MQSKTLHSQSVMHEASTLGPWRGVQSLLGRRGRRVMSLGLWSGRPLRRMAMYFGAELLGI